MTPSAHTAGGRRVRRWTRELIIEKILEWDARYGEPPCSADWNPSLARWRAQEWRAERYREGTWPSTNAAKRPFGGSFDAAIRAAGLEPRRPGPRRGAGEARPAIEQRRPDDAVVAAGNDGHAAAADNGHAASAGNGHAASAGNGHAAASGNGHGAASADVLAVAVERARRAEARAAALERAAEQRARELSALATNGRRRLTSGELAALRADGPSGPAVLAGALRRLAKARASGDRGGLRSALGEVASAAVRWHDHL